MSKFYKTISNYYEKIFPLNLKMKKFLLNSSRGKDILDIACGSGLMAKALQDDGKNVIAIDLEQRMVDLTIEKGVIAFNISMTEIDFDCKFDLIYCVGNSLPHLDNIDQVRKFFNLAKKHLKEEGILAVQIINFYPFLIKEGNYLGNLPTIKNDVEFIREYHRSGDKIRFHTILKADEVLENDEFLLPVTYDIMMEIMKEEGFDFEFFGNFDEEEFNKEKSISLILRAWDKR
ncbi:MAG: class I SAM-dependent methyltransferase [Tissierellia bacterium]|nr:class I SAM-dependent methyltransferase [Tissierellia bacterium]